MTRSGVATDTLTVDYATSDGTATAGADYTAKSGTFIFSARQTTKTFTIPIANDTLLEANETIDLTLSNPVGGLLGAQSTAVLTIVDNDGPGSIEFNAANLTVDESTPVAIITVIRSGGSVGVVTVDYNASNGTATASADYTATSGTLTFASGQTTKTFTIPIINDTIVEGSETINLTLSNPTGGASMGAQNTAALTILDNDLGGELSFSVATYKVSEVRPSATITVRRTGGLAGGVTVDYSRSDGTATAGQDYLASSGTLVFEAGQSSKTFTIPIINDTNDEANETINLALSNPTGGASLGAQNTAILTITDNDL